MSLVFVKIPAGSRGRASRIWRSLPLRLAAAFIALLIAAALAIGYLFDRGRAEVLEQRHLERLKRHAESSADEVERYIRRLQSDVLFLAHTPPIQGIRRAIEGGGLDTSDGSSLQQWQERLQQIFLAFAEARPEYAQIRLIGARDGGRELVRVERSGEALRVTAREDLQRKADRYYYQEAAMLPDGELYLSRIDLSLAHRQVSMPHPPTLRAATPVYAPGDGLFALLVINMDMGYAFQRTLPLRDEDEALYVVDRDGELVLHPDSVRPIASEQGRSFRLADAFPAQAEPITRALADRPAAFLELVDQGSERMAYLTARAWDPTDPARRLLFIVTEPMARVEAAAEPMRRDSLVGAGALLLLAIALVIAMVRRATGSLSALASASEAIAVGDYAVALPAPDRSEVGALVRAFRHMVGEVQRREEALARLNQELEERVRERTDALSRQHDLQRLILDNIADGVVVADRKGRFVLWNRKAEQIIGAGPDAVPPERWSAHYGIYLGEDGGQVPTEELPLVRAIRGEPTDNAELYLRQPGRQDGRWTQVTARPLRDHRGGTAGAVAVLVDVTEQKRLQAQLQGHRTELTRFGHLVLGAEIASSAAHQLSQPISAIANFATGALHLQTRGQLGAEELRNLLERFERLAAQAGKILDRLRARIRRREAAPTTFDLSRVLCSALAFFQDRLARQGITVDRDVDTDLPLLFGDPLELEHALIQLVSNALDALEAAAPGERRLSARTHVDTATGRVVATLTDTGPGVSPSLADRLFEPWETDKPGALGIGLTIAQTIVEGFGGQIRLQQPSNGGTTFRVELPIPAGVSQ
jgi:C4-dicarboxylate-specific signal transduction histidine kinase